MIKIKWIMNISICLFIFPGYFCEITHTSIAEEDNSLWSQWSPCSRQCVQTRYWLNNETSTFKHTRKCDLHPRCTIDTRQTKWQKIFSPSTISWSAWSACTRSCHKRRFRLCTNRRHPYCASGYLTEEKPCRVSGSSSCNKQLPEPSPSRSSTMAPDVTRTESTQIKSQTTSAPYIGGWNRSVCGQQTNKATLRIVGGQASRPGAWPWQVAILNRWKEHYCGGVLISPIHVLTAAHCIRRNGRRLRTTLIAGEYDLQALEGTEIILKQDKDFVHPLFDRKEIENDIAVIQLKSPVVSDHIGYACLPSIGSQFATGSLCKIVGWGKMKETHIFGTSILQEADVPLVSTAQCNQAFDFNITDHQMCAGFQTGGVDSCAGDSGGGLLCPAELGDVTRWVAYGITSFGEGCGDRGKFGIYTKVNYYADWINEIVNASRVFD